eukprot:12376311-Alexandrium_andersonii.AAC.1
MAPFCASSFSLPLRSSTGQASAADEGLSQPWLRWPRLAPDLWPSSARPSESAGRRALSPCS